MPGSLEHALVSGIPVIWAQRSSGPSLEQSLVLALVMAAIFMVIAAMRRGSSALGSRPRRIQAFTTTSSPQETLKAIIRFAQQAGYKIPAMDEAKGQLVLEEPASVTSFGFFFPVFVSQQSDGSTLVEVGIKSKVFQIGPIASRIVSRSHERCVTSMKAAFLAQTVERPSPEPSATVSSSRVERPATRNAEESPSFSAGVQATKNPSPMRMQAPEGCPSTSVPSGAPEWHVAAGGKSKGQFSPMELTAMARSGEITPSTMVWKQGMAGWVRLSEAPELASALEPPPLPPSAKRHS